MKLNEVLKNIQPLKVIGDAEVEVTGVNIDSRRIQDGHLFIAMKGTQVDGHKFISKAIRTRSKIYTLRRLTDRNGRRRYLRTS